MPELFILNALLLVAALNLDAFAVSFSYGVDKIKIPFISAMIINFICSAMLVAALFAGAFLKHVIPELAGIFVCSAILLSIGAYKLSDGIFKPKVFSVICVGNRKASLKTAEAVSLSFALSLDSLTAGFGAGLTESGFLWIISFSLLSTVLFIYAGSFLGRKLAERASLNLSWTSGVIFIFLGLSKLFS